MAGPEKPSAGMLRRILAGKNKIVLAGGLNTQNSGLAIETLRPIIFLLYYNSVLSYGSKDFFAACVKSGVDGLIIPDLLPLRKRKSSQR